MSRVWDSQVRVGSDILSQFLHEPIHLPRFHVTRWPYRNQRVQTNDSPEQIEPADTVHTAQATSSWPTETLPPPACHWPLSPQRIQPKEEATYTLSTQHAATTRPTPSLPTYLTNMNTTTVPTSTPLLIRPVPRSAAVAVPNPQSPARNVSALSALLRGQHGSPSAAAAGGTIPAPAPPSPPPAVSNNTAPPATASSLLGPPPLMAPVALLPLSTDASVRLMDPTMPNTCTLTPIPALSEGSPLPLPPSLLPLLPPLPSPPRLPLPHSLSLPPSPLPHPLSLSPPPGLLSPPSHPQA